MRKIAILNVLLFLLISVVSAADVGQFPSPEFADTEVSTNFTFAVRSRHIDPSWNLVKVTRRWLGVANENVTFFLVESGFGLTIR